MITRVFRAQIFKGKEEEFKTFFLDTAIPYVKAQKGFVSLHIGIPMTEEGETTFMMTSMWKDLDSVKKFAGDQWQKAVIHPDEKHLVEKVWMEHFYTVQP